MKPCNLRALAVEKDSAQKFGRENRVPGALQDHLVFLVDLVARMREPLCQFAVIREQEQAFALRIKATNVKEPRKLRRKKVKDGVARIRVAPGGDKTGRFVQGDRHRRIGVNDMTIDFDVVAFRRLHAEIGAAVSVDCNPASRDQLITIAARTDAGGGEKTIEAH